MQKWITLLSVALTGIRIFFEFYKDRKYLTTKLTVPLKILFLTIIFYFFKIALETAEFFIPIMLISVSLLSIAFIPFNKFDTPKKIFTITAIGTVFLFGILLFYFQI